MIIVLKTTFGEMFVALTPEKVLLQRQGNYE